MPKQNEIAKGRHAIIAIHYEGCFSNNVIRHATLLTIMKHHSELKLDSKKLPDTYFTILSSLTSIKWNKNTLAEIYSNALDFGVIELNSNPVFRAIFIDCCNAYAESGGTIDPYRHLERQHGELTESHFIPLTSAILRYYRPLILKHYPFFYDDINMIYNSQLTEFIKNLTLNYQRCTLAIISRLDSTEQIKLNERVNGNASPYLALRRYYEHAKYLLQTDANAYANAFYYCDLLKSDILSSLPPGSTMRLVEANKHTFSPQSIHEINRIDSIYLLQHYFKQDKDTSNLIPTLFELDDNPETLSTCRQFFMDTEHVPASSLLPEKSIFATRHYEDGSFTDTLNNDLNLSVTGTGKVDYRINESLRNLARLSNCHLDKSASYNASTQLSTENKLKFIQSRRLDAPNPYVIQTFKPASETKGSIAIPIRQVPAMNVNKL